MDALHENILQEESGIFEIRCVEWTKNYSFWIQKKHKIEAFRERIQNRLQQQSCERK